MTIANANIGSAFELFEVDEDVLMDRACKYLLVEEGELINTPLAFFSIKKHKQKKKDYLVYYLPLQNKLTLTNKA